MRLNQSMEEAEMPIFRMLFAIEEALHKLILSGLGGVFTFGMGVVVVGQIKGGIASVSDWHVIGLLVLCAAVGILSCTLLALAFLSAFFAAKEYAATQRTLGIGNPWITMTVLRKRVESFRGAGFSDSAAAIELAIDDARESLEYDFPLK